LFDVASAKKKLKIELKDNAKKKKNSSYYKGVMQFGPSMSSLGLQDS